jgi:hypothetical protein
MELKVRALQESDWETLQLWWNLWKWPVMSKDMLPLNGCGGLMIYKEEKLIAAGFLYLSNSKVAWLDWIISSPSYKEKDRREALELLILSLEEVARQQDYNIIISIARHKGLINTHRKLGYTVDDSASYEISKKIK